MKNNFEQQLQQDGMSIKAQAESRMAVFDVEQQVLNSIGSNSNLSKVRKSGYFGLAAAICLSILAWSIVQNSELDTQLDTQSPIVVGSFIDFKLEQISLSIEEKINQALLDEQQAIISDLKSLQQQLISI